MATRNIAFGYDDGTLNVDIILRRASDGYYWAGTTFTAAAPSPALTMTYDSVLGQYYTETSPSERCFWTAKDHDTGDLLAYGEYGGGYPVVSVASVSSYTIQEVIDRIRTEISDPDDDGNPRFSDAQLLNILDRCVGWLTAESFKRRTTIGLGEANYAGDGTEEWSLPSNFYALLYLVDPTAKTGAVLKQIPYSDYLRGDLALDVVGVEYFAIKGSNIYFVDHIPTGLTVKMLFYPKIGKLTVSTTVPFDGFFMDLMVEWGKTITLTTDEFSVDNFQSMMLRMFMESAQGHMSMKWAGPMRAMARQRDTRRAKRGKII